MSKTHNKKKSTMAATADKHELYEKSVQNAAAEIDFVDETFRKQRNRLPVTLREDFCGTAQVCYEWIRRRQDNIAHGVDIDPEVLKWGREKHQSRLVNGASSRLHIHNRDVIKVKPGPVDVVLAMNFSYWLFKDRATMKKYFKNVYNGLVEDGIFFLDAFGGYEAFQEMEESTKYKKFTYIWDQESYNPITGDCTFHIHFKFKDGSKLKQAFTYDWRLWTLPELTEMLGECGFKPAVYWEGTDKDGEGNGVFTPETRGQADASWVAYIVAEKQA